MTIALAFAATSEILRSIVADAVRMAWQDLALPTPSTTVGPPSAASATTEVSINIFLYQAAPSDSWRNAAGFIRRPSGGRLELPPSALDLGYLVSAHGAGTGREIAFAVALQALQQTPIISAERIKTALMDLASDEDPVRRMLASEDLAIRFENLALEPRTIGIDSTTRLWAALETPLCPSATYQAALLFKDDAATSPAPPVV